MQQHKNLRGDQLGTEVDKESWEPSVKALTEFSAVLANNHNTYISHSRTIVNRNSFNSTRGNFNHVAGSPGRTFGGHQGFTSHTQAGTHSGAFSGFNHGGVARANSFRGQSSFGGFHGGVAEASMEEAEATDRSCEVIKP